MAALDGQAQEDDDRPAEGGREDFVEGKRPEDGPAHKAPLMAPPAADARPSFAWPWGLVAIGIMALAWIGLYLLWNGVVFVFGL